MDSHFEMTRMAPFVLAFGLACGNATGPEGCRDAVPLPDGSCLLLLTEPVLARAPAIERVISETMREVSTLLPLDPIRIRVEASQEGIIPEIGIGGRAFAGEEVRITIDPDFPGLAASLETDLFPLLAHELHHIARQQTVGYGSTLLGAVISEGLADHFSIEVAGVDPPLWSVALSETELATWRAEAELVWRRPTYDHEEWFFGTGATIPRWAGYSIGFAVVGEYLAAAAGRRASALFDEPPGSFVP